MVRNQYFTLSTTFEHLIWRIEDYAAVFPPSGSESIRLIVEPPLLLLGEKVRSWAATAFFTSSGDASSGAASSERAGMALFQLGVQEATDGTCRVRARCLEPDAESWYRAMLDWLAPDQASGDPQPARTPQPSSSSGKLSKSTGSRRGPKSTPVEERDPVCERWLRVQYKMTQEQFGRQESISVSTLQAWLRDYRRRHEPS